MKMIAHRWMEIFFSFGGRAGNGERFLEKWVNLFHFVGGDMRLFFIKTNNFDWLIAFHDLV